MIAAFESLKTPEVTVGMDQPWGEWSYVWRIPGVGDGTWFWVERS